VADDYNLTWRSGRDLPPLSQLRYGLTTHRGVPVRFLIQLEYWHAGKWLEVARSEHDVDGPAYRNVEISGIHVDVMHPDGEQGNKLTGWPPQPANEAMGDAEHFLRVNANRFVRRFEKWL